MYLKNQFLDEWLIAYNKGTKDFRCFPFSYDYPTKYHDIANKLEKWVHPFVNQGAMLQDNGFLTNHGPDHIKTVIKRATQLVANMNKKDELSPYEVYILLMAIQVHDVGNIISRNGHEESSVAIIDHLT